MTRTTNVSILLTMVIAIFCLVGCPRPQTGSLQVTLEPEAAVNAGAGWCVDGGA